LSLIEGLHRARTEEDVKDAYIKALGLKTVFKGLVDIQTPEIWFEAKETPTPPLLMFAQLLTYVRAARKRGEPIPGFLCVIDREKAALMPTEHALPPGSSRACCGWLASTGRCRTSARSAAARRR
jgi:hypothetical protein